MNPFYLCLMGCPLAVYFLVLGAVQLRTRTTVVRGIRDRAGLSLAMFGLVLGGPMQLFLPQQAAAVYHGYIWILLVGFYLLITSLWLLVARPRLVLYNTRTDTIMARIESAARRSDEAAVVIGDNILLPTLGVQAHLERFAPLRNVSIVATGDAQNIVGWRRFEAVLRAELAEESVTPAPYAVTMVLGAVLLLADIFYHAGTSPEQVAEGLSDMLRL